MTSTVRDRAILAVIASAFVAALLGGQAVGDASVPSVQRLGATQPVGRAGFAYVTGLRRFAAVVLYNRLEPQFHEYYRKTSVDKLYFLMPNFRIITWLDPEFAQPYYLASWILYRNDRKEDAYALAKEAVEANPRSGQLLTSYAQLLYLGKKDTAEQVRQADAVMRLDTVWESSNEQWESMQILVDIYKKAGYPERAEQAKAIAAKVEQVLGGAPGFKEEDERF